MAPPNKKVKLEQSFGIGIIGTGMIANFIAGAIAESKRCYIAAVGSRSKENAVAFIGTWNGDSSHAYGSYDEVFADESVQCVYLTAPTALRAELVDRATRAGKHILCEKPFVNVADAENIVSLCRQRNVFFQDATNWVNHARSHQIRDRLRNGEFGRIQLINAAFNYPFDDEAFAKNIRAQPSIEPNGCLADVGWYCAAALSFFLQGTDVRPVRVTCVVDRSLKPSESFADNSNDELNLPIVSGMAMIVFTKGVRSHLDFGYRPGTVRQWVEISCEKATIRIDDFVQPWLESFDFPRDRSRRDASAWTYTVQVAPPSCAITLCDGHDAPASQHIDMVDNVASAVLDVDANTRAERFEANASFSVESTRLIEKMAESCEKKGDWINF